MLLNNENVDYLLEWPAYYYEIEDINERERILQLAIEQKLDPALEKKTEKRTLWISYAARYPDR